MNPKASETFLEGWDTLDAELNETDKAKLQAILDAAKRNAEKRDGKEFDVMMHADWILTLRPFESSRLRTFMEKAAELRNRDLIFCLGSPAGDREEKLKRAMDN